MEKCLYCYKPLKPGQVDYHPACARKLFGTKEAPVLPYVRKEIGDLAKQVVRAQTTLTSESFACTPVRVVWARTTCFARSPISFLT